jgi:hypothetical protein
MSAIARERSMIMREQIVVGVTLRVIASRWDRPAGTIAKATEMGILPTGKVWWSSGSGLKTKERAKCPISGYSAHNV